MKKVLILGSGALKIGEAGEFDYSGSQAIKAFKEEGIKTILVNPNIATVQTSRFLADEIYFLPITPEFVEKIIEKEKPDGIAISFGGQTGLNCGIDLYRKGVFKKHHIHLLGTPIESVIVTEDRKLFASHIKKIPYRVPESAAVSTLSQAIAVSRKMVFPLMIRAAYALGGQKSGVAHNKEELIKMVREAFSFSPQVLIEKYLLHFKEIEYEVVRDRYDNCICVCNMENLDPMGVHTGDSLVIAPSQTLSNTDYHTLRKAAIDIVRSLDIVGECNVQFAVNPSPENNAFDFYVIELNARLSRSSALASKATGYPLAYVAAKLLLGKNLKDIPNKITYTTQSFFEPALDYVAIKIPRWDLEKFKNSTEIIGSSMQSVGEVMALGRGFEETLQKAIRMLDIGFESITQNPHSIKKSSLEYYLKNPTPKRIFAIALALKLNYSVKKIYQLTGIDPWFLERINSIVSSEKKFIKRQLNSKNFLFLKQMGFSDRWIAIKQKKDTNEISKMRKKMSITPCILQIDTLAGEMPAKTNYLYTTYHAFHNDVAPTGKKAVMVLGSGPYRIGSSVEFDWSSVHTALALRRHRKKTIVINCNPETVSTDYDISDRLYFEELSFERVTDIFEFENAEGIILSVGGQTPNNLSQSLQKKGIKIIGTHPDSIDKAENRSSFSHLLDKLHIQQPAWKTFTHLRSAYLFARKVGYPVLVRPSYVLSGQAMSICHNENDLSLYLHKATLINSEHPVTLSKFITDAREVEIDAVAHHGKLIVSAICDHVENAGIHSGDATIIYPTQLLSQLKTDIIETTKQLAKELKINGPFNIQFLIKNDTLYVIEMNLRASRTLPFLSKATGVNFIDAFIDSYSGKTKEHMIRDPQYFLVKTAQFSYSRVKNADPVSGVEMSSTGEVACLGKTICEAFLKAELAVGGKIPSKGLLIVTDKTVPQSELQTLFSLSQKLKLRTYYKIVLNKKDLQESLKYIENKKIDMCIVISNTTINGSGTLYQIRRAAIDSNIYLLTDMKKAQLFLTCLRKNDPLLIRSWNDYETK